jgi:hypothetical protein
MLSLFSCCQWDEFVSFSVYIVLVSPSCIVYGSASSVIFFGYSKSIGCALYCLRDSLDVMEL